MNSRQFFLGLIASVFLVSTVVLTIVRGATSGNFQLSQEQGGPVTLDAVSEHYFIKAEIGHPGVGQSVSSNYIFDHGTWWDDSVLVLAAQSLVPVSAPVSTPDLDLASSPASSAGGGREEGKGPRVGAGPAPPPVSESQPTETTIGKPAILGKQLATSIPAAIPTSSQPAGVSAPIQTKPAPPPIRKIVINVGIGRQPQSVPQPVVMKTDTVPPPQWLLVGWFWPWKVLAAFGIILVATGSAILKRRPIL